MTNHARTSSKVYCANPDQTNDGQKSEAPTSLLPHTEDCHMEPLTCQASLVLPISYNANLLMLFCFALLCFLFACFDLAFCLFVCFLWIQDLIKLSRLASNSLCSPERPFFLLAADSEVMRVAVGDTD